MDIPAEGKGCLVALLYSVLMTVMVVAITVAVMFWEGYVLRKLWCWFITPAFHLAAPSWTLTAGLVLILSMFSTDSRLFKDHKIDAGASAFAAIWLPANVLVCGWLIHLMVR